MRFLPALANFAGFQVVWLANCLGAAGGHPHWGPLVTVAWLAVHLGFFERQRATELSLIASSALLGYCADSLLVMGGWISFPEATRLGGPSPLWMVALWAGFAGTLRHSLRWLSSRYVLAAIIGSIFGPLAYLAGQALGAIELSSPVTSVMAVSIEYLIALPVLVALAGWYEARLGPALDLDVDPKGVS